MKSLIQSRPIKALPFVVLAVVFAVSFVIVWGNFQQQAFSSIWVNSNFEALMEGKARIREGEIKAEVINSSPIQPASIPAVAPSGFTPQTRLGFNVENEWEPAIAADRFGHVYMLNMVVYRVVRPAPTPHRSYRSATTAAIHGALLL